VILASKAYDSQSAAGWLARLAGPDTTVVVLQNGVDHVESNWPTVSSPKRSRWPTPRAPA
jgi:2-dehydropantoate 2-reductase